MTKARWGRGARGRTASVRRVLLLWKAVEGRRYRPTTRELASQLGVHPKTVRRDIAVLEELHFAVPPQPPACFEVSA